MSVSSGGSDEGAHVVSMQRWLVQRARADAEQDLGVHREALEALRRTAAAARGEDSEEPSTEAAAAAAASRPAVVESRTPSNRRRGRRSRVGAVPASQTPRQAVQGSPRFRAKRTGGGYVLVGQRHRRDVPALQSPALSLLHSMGIGLDGLPDAVLTPQQPSSPNQEPVDDSSIFVRAYHPAAGGLRSPLPATPAEARRRARHRVRLRRARTPAAASSTPKQQSFLRRGARDFEDADPKSRRTSPRTPSGRAAMGKTPARSAASQRPAPASGNIVLACMTVCIVHDVYVCAFTSRASEAANSSAPGP